MISTDQQAGYPMRSSEELLQQRIKRRVEFLKRGASPRLHIPFDIAEKLLAVGVDPQKADAAVFAVMDYMNKQLDKKAIQIYRAVAVTAAVCLFIGGTVGFLVGRFLGH
jgi:hypothetical protein